MKATGSAALGRSTKRKAGETAHPEGVVSTQMGRAPRTRRKPGYTGSNREEPGQVSLPTVQDPGLLSSDSFSPLTNHYPSVS